MRTSYKALLASVLPLALEGAGDDEAALLLVQHADMALTAARDHQRDSQRLNYEANKAKVIQAAQAWAEANRDRKNESRRKRYVSAGGHRQAKTREYAAIRAASGKTAAYRDATREEHRAWSRNRSAAVTESYAREQLAKGSQLAAKDFPEAIVHAKQALIKLKRELK